MKTKRLIFILALVAAAGFAIWLMWENPQVKSWRDAEESQAPATNPPSSSQGMPQPSVAPAVPPPPGASPRFVQFLGQESVRMDSTNVDTAEAERRSEEEADLMGPLEIQYARDTVLSGKGSANQRVLALYLLTQAGPKAAGALREIVLAPLPDGRVSAHSEEEHKLMQEKAQRITAIDELVEQARRDPAARDSLLRLADEVRDPDLRRYILTQARSLAR
jgi:hypothetical protein